MATEKEMLLEALKTLEYGETLSFFRSPCNGIVIRFDKTVDLGRCGRKLYRHEVAITRQCLVLEAPNIGGAIQDGMERARVAIKAIKDGGGNERSDDGL